MSIVRKIRGVIRDPSRGGAFLLYNYYKFRRAQFPQWSTGLDLKRACQFMPDQGLKLDDSSKVLALVGMPRSGTTLLSRLFDSASTITLSEPYLAYLFDGYFRWRDVAGVERTTLDAPSDFIRKFTQGGADFDQLIFKETWRSEQGFYPSLHFIAANVRNGIKTIAIIRNPLDVWSSVLKISKIDSNELPSKGFMADWVAYSKFLHTERVPFVHYEDLVQDAAGALRNVLEAYQLDLQIAPDTLKPTSGLGDPSALSGGKVHQSSVNKHADQVDEFLASIDAETLEELQSRGYFVG